MFSLVGIYILGVAIGLIVMQDRWTTRIITALVWPLGVVAFLVVVAILSAASVYLWPVPILATLAVASAVWFAL